MNNQGPHNKNRIAALLMVLLAFLPTILLAIAGCYYAAGALLVVELPFLHKQVRAAFPAARAMVIGQGVIVVLLLATSIAEEQLKAKSTAIFPDSVWTENVSATDEALASDDDSKMLSALRQNSQILPVLYASTCAYEYNIPSIGGMFIREGIFRATKHLQPGGKLRTESLSLIYHRWLTDVLAEQNRLLVERLDKHNTGFTRESDVISKGDMVDRIVNSIATKKGFAEKAKLELRAEETL